MNVQPGYALLFLTVLAGCGSDPEPVEEEAPAPVLEEPVDLGQTVKQGMVMLRAKKAPLREQILPEFEKQAGVRITWTGTERLVTIRMIKPMEWREALELVCQFTGTHVTTDYQGRLLLKNSYGGTLTSDNLLLEEELRRRNRDHRKSSGAPAASPTSSSRSSTDRKPRRSASAQPSVKYNKGRKPGSIFDSIGSVTH